METIKRVGGLIKRFLRGEDVSLIQLSKESWDNQYHKGSWDRLMGGEPNTTRIAEMIADECKARATKLRILDMGSGNGALARMLSSNKGILYTGIDFSEKAIELARRNVPTAKFMLAAADNLPANIGEFDIFVCNELLYYIDPKKVISACKAHARSRSIVIISIVSFPRSYFVWRKVARHIKVVKKEKVKDLSSKRSWAIGTAYFKK